MKGTLDRRREPAELIISKIMPIETAAAELARGVVVRLHKGVHQEADLERLLRFVRVRPGHLDLFLEIVGSSMFVALSTKPVRHYASGTTSG